MDGVQDPISVFFKAPKVQKHAKLRI